MMQVTLPKAWRAEDDRTLMALHGKMTIAQVAQEMGRSSASIRARVTTLGIAARPMWSKEHEDILRAAYTAAGADGFVNLNEVAERLGRHKTNVCRKARELGLPTSATRRKVMSPKVRVPMFETVEARLADRSARMKRHIAVNGHVKGFKGKSHSQQAKILIGAAASTWWASMPEEKKQEHIMKALRTKVERHGQLAPNVKRGSWKAGWRDIGGRRVYFRSRWEANYGRYLEWLRVNGHIRSWEHEPETFWFESIKRGVRSYLPDFLVTEQNGDKAYHEVKGWMDSRSKTTISRFRKYYPQHKLIVIEAKAYHSIERKVSGLVSGWEASS